MKSNGLDTGGPMPLLFMAAALGLSLLLLRLALPVQALDQFFSPPPEQVSAMLVQALGAHRFEGARNHLSQKMKGRISEADLRALVDEIEQGRGEIESAEGLDSQEQGERANARLRVKFSGGGEEVLQFRLVRENFVWKVDRGDWIGGE